MGEIKGVRVDCLEIDGKLIQQTVLDHGYVKFIEMWGSDERIVEAARMSTQKGFLGWGTGRCKNCGQTSEQCTDRGLAGDQCPDGNNHDFDRGDQKLLDYLWKNNHRTPFEMCGSTVEIQAPIFVFREWHRHRTQSYNEMSARYEPLPDVNYIPSVERLMVNAAGSNKQANRVAGSAVLDEQHAEQFRGQAGYVYARLEELYQSALKAGVPKELARIVLPVGRYSRMRASANLRNWLQFLTLRDDPAAQWEIRQFAMVVASMLRARFPRTMQLFDAGRTW